MSHPREVHNNKPCLQSHGRCHRNQLGGKYVGLTANSFKQQYGGHKQNFSKYADRTKSTLAGHVWNLQDKHEGPEVSLATPFSPSTGVCILCTSEKWPLIFKSENATLN